MPFCRAISEFVFISDLCSSGLAVAELRGQRENKCMKTFACRDVGMNCEWTTTGKDENEVMSKASEHGRMTHGLTDMPRELVDKVKGAIREYKSTG